jgi:hypothetical protein
MKIIVSSKSLAECLNKIDFENGWVDHISTMVDAIVFNPQAVVLPVVIASDKKDTIPQMESSWVSVKKLVNQISEQPIVVDILKNSVEVIFKY